ncbi:MAG: hydrogenase maturation protease [Vicinamibacterales bacterium]
MTAAATPLARVVVLGCGNPSRGDDALGPALMARVAAWVACRPGRPVEAVEDFQLQVEHTLDLCERDLALFVDAVAGGPAAVRLRRAWPARAGGVSTHALAPEALLHAYSTLGRGAPPPAYVLAVRGRAFDLGAPLTPEAARNLETAWAVLERLLGHPARADWDALCASGPTALP